MSGKKKAKAAGAAFRGMSYKGVAILPGDDELVKMRQLYELLRDRFSFVEKMCGKLSDDVRMVIERVDKHEARLLKIGTGESRERTREIVVELLEKLRSEEEEMEDER